MTAYAPRPNPSIASMLHVGRKSKRRQPATPTPINWYVDTSHGRVVIRIYGLRLVSEGNRRGHWAITHKRKCVQQEILAAALRGVNLWHWVTLPLRVTTCRVAPRRYDTDNAVSATKHLRDALAMAFGLDDRDDRIDWQVTQRRGEPKEYSVEIFVESAERTSS